MVCFGVFENKLQFFLEERKPIIVIYGIYMDM